MKELRIWWHFTLNAFQQVLTNRFLVVLFTFSKTIRFLLFLFFLSFIFQDAQNLAGYTRDQIIFFYLGFNLIDTAAQLFFREVYRFRPLVVSGGLDHILLKPVNPLIRVLLGGADVLDLIMLFIILFITLLFGFTHITTDPLAWLGFTLLLVNGLIVSAALHIIVLGLSVITVNVDHLIMIYRDFTALLRIPVDLYIAPIRWFLIFIIPVGVMFTFPSQMLMGLLSPAWTAYAFIVSFSLLYFSLVFWNYSLKFYQSASS